MSETLFRYIFILIVTIVIGCVLAYLWLKTVTKKEKLIDCGICGKEKVLPSQPMCENCYRWIRFG